MAQIPESSEKILVCVGASPSATGVINAARTIAESLHASFLAVNVEDPRALVLSESEGGLAVENLRAAERLGAETVTLSGRGVAEEIIGFARECGVTRIVAGKPGRSLWKSIFSGSPVDRLVRMSGEIDVYVTSGEKGGAPMAAPRVREKSADVSDYGAAFLFLILSTVVCFIMFPFFQLSNLIMIYLLGVMITATTCGRGPALLMSLLSVLAFDFCFVPPRWTFTVEDAQYIVTFIVMFLVAFVISHLAAQMRRQAELARLRERQIAGLHGLSHRLSGTRGIDEILNAAVQYISEIFNCRVAVLTPDDKGRLRAAGGDPSSVLQTDILKEMEAARSAQETGRMTGWKTGDFPNAKILCVPLLSGAYRPGVLVLRAEDPERFPTPDHLGLLESLAKQAALALEVEQLTSACGKA